MEIVKLESHQIKKASEVLVASFFNYPMFAFYFPDVKRRKRNLPWYFGSILNTAFRYGRILITKDVSGVLFTLPPGHTNISIWEYVQSGFLLAPIKLGLRNYARSMDCEQFVEDAQERLMGNRHRLYLWGLAVDPARKGKGIGSALMQPILEEADRERLPIYLETHDRENLKYYQRYAFELISEEMVPRYDLPFWCMVREPGSGG